VDVRSPGGRFYADCFSSALGIVSVHLFQRLAKLRAVGAVEPADVYRVSETEAAYTIHRSIFSATACWSRPSLRPAPAPTRWRSRPSGFLPANGTTGSPVSMSRAADRNGVGGYQSFPIICEGRRADSLQPYSQRMTTAPLTNLIIRCYPGPDGQSGSTTLYEDDGVTTGYRKGNPHKRT